MHIKKVILPFVLGIILVTLPACSIFGSKKPKDVAAKEEAKGRARIVTVADKVNDNTSGKLDEISALAYGTDYALSKINDPPREVSTARTINQRVTSLAGNPSLEQMKDMQLTIDNLISELATERSEGKIKLEAKDAEITTLQTETRSLSAAKESEIRKYMHTAQTAAAASDEYKSELQDYKGWFGLKAVFKGLGQFIKSSLLILVIGGIIFFVLRIASASNPIAASIFSVFNMIGSWVINTIKVIVPKAVEMAGHVTSDTFNVYKTTLSKIVDGIQIVKDRATAAGKSPDLNSVLDEVAKSMNTEEKQIVDEIKNALNWK